MKNKSIIYISLLLAGLVVFAGCESTTGNESLRKESEASIAAKIIEGKSMKEEVRAAFGSPLTTSFTDGGLEIWNFELSKMKADAVNYIPLVGLFGATESGTKKQLVILFDENDVVKKVSMSESPVKVKTGIFNK